MHRLPFSVRFSTERPPHSFRTEPYQIQPGPSVAPVGSKLHCVTYVTSAGYSCFLLAAYGTQMPCWLAVSVSPLPPARSLNLALTVLSKFPRRASGMEFGPSTMAGNRFRFPILHSGRSLEPLFCSAAAEPRVRLLTRRIDEIFQLLYYSSARRSWSARVVFNLPDRVPSSISLSLAFVEEVPFRLADD